MSIANNVESLSGVSTHRQDRSVGGVERGSLPITMKSSFLRKALFAFTKGITSPRSTVSWIVRGHLATDPVFVSHTYWFTGALPRVALAEIFPGIERQEVVLPRAFDRNTAAKTGASITVDEACHLAAIARWLEATRTLEIGTYDGNTALVLAANAARDGRVVTVDLPPDFTTDQHNLLAFSEGDFNLTARHDLGRQTKNHPLASRIEQVYGDSASLDWNTLGGPFDLVFIDGCHSEAYVQSDTRNAIEHLRPGGVVVWHDYGMIPEVSAVVDRLAGDDPSIEVNAIQGTRLAVGVTGGQRRGRR
jgi:predicted O-methyltransferase YrrM